MKKRKIPNELLIALYFVAAIALLIVLKVFIIN